MKTGTRLGPYEIAGQIGAGGMGEVYRARDTKLGRDVAIKVLPPRFAADGERVARFEREAQTLASLNHPNIAQIYGVLDDPAALVMELVEGEDLSERLRRGPLPLDEALAVARQIADALAAAHERGIIHRDLKPANVKVRPDGPVKVLDFGLAKAMAAGHEGSGPGAGSAIANSPTFTSPAMLTSMGVILGTAAYMSPEQARGKVVDRRADIWAFGCVLYEMLTGVRAFAGESTADLMHAILGRDPDWARLPPGTPARVRDVLTWCLRRDPADRLKDAGDLRLLLSDVEGAAPLAAVNAAPPPSRRVVAALGWAAAVLLAAALAWTRVHAPAPPAPHTLHVELPLAPPADAIQQEYGSSLALSPDGARLAYVARQGSAIALVLRDLETGETRPLPDTEHASAPFFSPDGSAVAFAAGDRLRALTLTSPLARDVARLTAGGNQRVFGDWTRDGILFFDGRAIVRVPADGGPPAPLAPLAADEAGFVSVRGAPGGRLLVSRRLTASNKTDDPSQIAIVDPASGERRVLIDRGGSPVLMQDGIAAFLVYARDGRLWAAKLDRDRMAVVGTPQPVVDNVDMRPNGDSAQFAVSAGGTLVYMEGARSELVWVDGSGKTSAASTVLRRFAMPRLSPDGRAIAVEVQDVPHQTWLLDPDRDLLTPLTQWKEGSHDFAWAPDGRSIVFTGSTGGKAAVTWTPIDGSRAPVRLDLPGDAAAWVEDWSRDGRRLAVARRGHGEVELQIVPIAPGAPPTSSGPPVTMTRGRECGLAAQFSPDSRWLAWAACAGGTDTASIVIARVDGGSRVTIDEGSEPRWSRSGSALYYRKGASVMRVDVGGGATPVIGRPARLFDGNFLEWGSTNYDVAADGRLLMVRAAASAAGRAVAVRVNWIEELKKLPF